MKALHSNFRGELVGSPRNRIIEMTKSHAIVRFDATRGFMLNRPRPVEYKLSKMEQQRLEAKAHILKQEGKTTYHSSEEALRHLRSKMKSA